MTKVTDGVRVYDYNHLLTGDTEAYAHEGGLFALYSREKGTNVQINAIGMTAEEIERAIDLANTLLERGPISPVNRQQRRAAQSQARTH